MNSKQLEKMFEVMVSLEPTSPRPSRMEEVAGDNFLTNRKSDLESMNTFQEQKKSSLPLNIAPPSIRRGSADTRKSLFQNERVTPSSSSHRMTLFRANSKLLGKVAQEIDFVEISDEEMMSFHGDEKTHVYEKFVIPKDLNVPSNDTDPNSSQKRDTLTSLNIEYRPSANPKQRNSLEIINKMELRCSNLSENACQSRSVGEQSRGEKRQQSAPESARNSAINPQLSSKENQWSIDSGVDQTVSVDLRSFLSNEVTNSSESFSDISESNPASVVEKMFESPEMNTWMSQSAAISKKSDISTPKNESSQPKFVPVIKSEEEKNKFIRMISNEMSLNSLATKEIIRFFRRDGAFSSNIIDKFQTASSVCSTLKQKYMIREESKYQIVEVITKDFLERKLEDHENILDIFYSWGNENHNNKFIFQESPAMYIIFTHPGQFMEEMKVDFEITDTLWVRPINAKWVRTVCYIKESTIYFTTKQGSKDSKDANSLVDLKKIDVYTSSNPKQSKKEYKSQTIDLIVFKENKLNHRPQDSQCIATFNVQQKEKWLEAIKVAKFSFKQLKNNFMKSQMCSMPGIRSQSGSQVPVEEPLIQFEPCSI